MICLRCTIRISLRPLCSETTSSASAGPLSKLRPFTTSHLNHANSTTPTTFSVLQGGPSLPSRASTSAVHSSSGPQTPSPPNTVDTQHAIAEGSRKSLTPAIVSSVPAGTPLKGLNYFKNRSDPIAMEDYEYPDWLWTVLSDGGKKGAASGGKVEIDPRIYSKSAKSRRMANKRARAANPEGVALVEKVPLYAQSIDLPSGDGTARGAAEALGAREDLTKAMRGKRRKDIKEANFLKGMR